MRRVEAGHLLKIRAMPSMPYVSDIPETLLHFFPLPLSRPHLPSAHIPKLVSHIFTTISTVAKLP